MSVKRGARTAKSRSTTKTSSVRWSQKSVDRTIGRVIKRYSKALRKLDGK